MRLLVPLLLGLAALAGCTDSGGGAGGDATGPEAAALAVEPPTWQVGQYWSYASDQGGFTLVVSANETTYILDTDDDGLALFHAREDVSFVGPISKSDLAGDQGGQKVRFFQWPLQDGATWSATWDGVQRSITAAAQGDGTFEMTAMQDGRVAVEYVYDPDVEWFSSMTFFDENGTSQGSLELDDHGTGFSGELVRWQVEEGHFDESWGGSEGGTDNFEVPETVTHLAYVASIDCASAEAGHQALQMGHGEDASGTGQIVVMEQDPPVDLEATCPATAYAEGTLDARSGTWLVRALGVSDGATLSLTVDLLTREGMTL